MGAVFHSCARRLAMGRFFSWGGFLLFRKGIERGDTVGLGRARAVEDDP